MWHQADWPIITGGIALFVVVLIGPGRLVCHTHAPDQEPALT